MYQAMRAGGMLTVVLVALGATPKTPAQGAATGVLVRIYDVAAALRELPELVDGELPSDVRVSPTIDLHLDRKDFGEREGSFVTEVVGRLKVDKKGTYVFRLTSDDGAKLWIGDELVVDHDGIHGPTPVDGARELDVGEHDLRILHFNAHGGSQLRLEWQPPQASEDRVELVPATALRFPADASRDSAPGKKRIIPGLRRGLPGDGTPVAGRHRAFRDCEHRGMLQYRAAVRIRSGFLWRAGYSKDPDSLTLFAWVPGAGRSEADSMGWVDGLYENQLRVCAHPDEKRIFMDDRSSRSQGCAFRFTRDLGSVIKPTGQEVFEMLAVRAMSNGFEIEFTKPLDSRVGWEPESYYIEQWPFRAVWARLSAKPEACQPPKRDGVAYPVKSASVAPDRRKVFLEIPNLKPSHVVYLRLLPPCISEGGERPWSTEAWYTLNAIPADRPGTVLAPPAREPQNVLTEAEQQAGWRLLFDGQSPRGWRGYKKDRFPDGWQVRDGCLVRVGPGGDICTEEEFDNFELQLEWRISAGGNSGIFFRVDESAFWPWETGPEMQVLDNAEHADGRNPKTSAGSNYALHAPVRDVTEPVGLFNRVRLVVNGPHVEHWLNGVKVVEYALGSPEWEQLVAESKFKSMPRFGRVARGRIVLQDHGDRVWYRNIKVRPLGP
ncbi:MAG: family 16 glycoside hydrolase [Planctomycetota bacterium]